MASSAAYSEGSILRTLDWVISGHVRCNYRGPLWANSGLMHRSERADDNSSWPSNSRRESIDWSRRLLAAMPDCVNLPRIGDIGSRIAIEHHQIGKLA